MKYLAIVAATLAMTGCAATPISPAPRAAPSEDVAMISRNSKYKPAVLVAPNHPREAKYQEGWVVVEFELSDEGKVVDPRVYDSSPEGVFDAIAVLAVSKWYYFARTVQEAKDDGVTTHRRLIVFDL